MLNIILFGPPGAGKGTQSQKLIEKYNLIHLATGDLFRKHLSEGTDLGLLAKKYMNEGHLVPDKVVIGMVREKVNENPTAKGFIFDGFPRTVPQAEALDKLMAENNTPILGMVALDVPKEELKKRLLERGKVSGRADDVNEEKINIRIQVYLDETLPVAEYYNKKGEFKKINGVGEINEIFNNICKAVESISEA